MSLPGIGDIPFKQPQEFTRRILYNLYPGIQDTSAWDNFLNLNHTPPYISSEPEITHVRLDLLGPTARVDGEIPLRFLILSSDGLTDLCEGPGLERIIDTWARNLKKPVAEDLTGQSSNMALRMLWHALGEESEAVSKFLVQTDDPWIDDTSIIVQSIDARPRIWPSVPGSCI